MRQTGLTFENGARLQAHVKIMHRYISFAGEAPLSLLMVAMVVDHGVDEGGGEMGEKDDRKARLGKCEEPQPLSFDGTNLNRIHHHQLT